METYQFTKRVSADGTLLLENLPPEQEFFISVRPKVDQTEFERLLGELRESFQKNSPLAKMSEQEILVHLRQVRQEVADELYPDL